MNTPSSGAGRCVLVTGAAGGIGQAIVQRLRQDGWQVFAADRAGAPAPAEAGVRWLSCDLASEAGIAELAATVAEAGPLHGLVHGAAVIDPAPWNELAAEEMVRIYRINAVAPLVLTRALAGVLAPGAGVVLFGSIGALRASPATAAYSASKAAIGNIAATLSQVLAPAGVRVNVLAPGLIDTPLTGALNVRLAAERGTDAEAVARSRVEPIPLGRMGTAAEVADACAFLLGAQAGYITGSTLYLTGGVMAGVT